MSRSKLAKIFKDKSAAYIDDYYQRELDCIESVRRSIKDPINYYATYDMNTGEVQYIKKEKPGKKRVVRVKPLEIGPGE